MRWLALWLPSLALLAGADGQTPPSPLRFPLPTALRAHQAGVNALAFSPDSHLLVTAGSDGAAFVWDTGSSQRLLRLEHVYPVQSVAFNSTGSQVLTGGGKTLILWDSQTGKQLQEWEEFSGSVNSVAFQPGGSLMAVGNTNRTVELWDSRTGERRELSAHTAAVRQVLFTPGGQQVISGSQDGQVKFWEVASGRVLRTLTPGGVVASMALDKHGTRLVVGTLEGKVTVFSVNDGRLLASFEQAAGVNSVAFSLDNDLLMVGTLDRKLALWSLAGGRAALLDSLDNPASITGMAHSSDGQFVAVGRSSTSDRQNVALYRVEDRRIASTAELPPAPQLKTRRLLVVGAAIEEFGEQSGIGVLNSTVDDVKELGLFFEKLQGSALYSRVHSRLLLNEDATRERVLDSLVHLAKSAGPDDLVLLFFSSHGDNIGGKYYFVTYDADLKNPASSMISGAELTAALGKIRGQVVLFLDTCHAGQAGKTRSVGVRPDANPQVFIAQASQQLKADGHVIVAAAGPDEYANEAGGNGLFSLALLEGLRGAARARPGQPIGLQELLAYTQRRVPELVEQVQGKPQHPAVTGLSTQQNWPVVP